MSLEEHDLNRVFIVRAMRKHHLNIHTREISLWSVLTVTDVPKAELKGLRRLHE
jgi:hypothetical protein